MLYEVITSYFFNVDANESIETALGDEYYYYFSPDKIYVDEYIDFLPTGNYKSEAMYNLVDEPINHCRDDSLG